MSPAVMHILVPALIVSALISIRQQPGSLKAYIACGAGLFVMSVIVWLALPDVVHYSRSQKPISGTDSWVLPPAAATAVLMCSLAASRKWVIILQGIAAFISTFAWLSLGAWVA
jgi:hypothetical protein